MQKTRIPWNRVVPAFYGLYWITPDLVNETINLINAITQKPVSVLCLKRGFESLCQKILTRFKDSIKVVLNANVTQIDRFLDDPTKRTKITYDIKNSSSAGNDMDNNINSTCDHDDVKKVFEIECDCLFLACGMTRALPLMKDATKQEIEIFSHIKWNIICTTLYQYDVDKNTSSVQIWPNNVYHSNGHIDGERKSALCLLANEKYKQFVENQIIKKDKWIAYQFLDMSKSNSKFFEHMSISNDGDVGMGINIRHENSEEFVKIKAKLSKVLKQDLDVIGRKNVQILNENCFLYFPIFDQESIDKNCPWIVKDEMQGKYKNAYYIGSSVHLKAFLVLSSTMLS